MVDVFKPTIFSKSILLKTPTFYGRLVGRPCSCMLYRENHFKLERDWVVVIWCIHLIIIVVSIGIIGLFQLVPIIDISLYTHIFVCMHAYISNVINFNWYLTFLTYICFICASYIHISLWTRCVWICMYTLICIGHTYTLKNK